MGIVGLITVINLMLVSSNELVVSLSPNSLINVTSSLTHSSVWGNNVLDSIPVHYIIKYQNTPNLNEWAMRPARFKVCIGHIVYLAKVFCLDYICVVFPHNRILVIT